MWRKASVINSILQHWLLLTIDRALHRRWLSISLIGHQYYNAIMNISYDSVMSVLTSFLVLLLLSSARHTWSWHGRGNYRRKISWFKGYCAVGTSTSVHSYIYPVRFWCVSVSEVRLKYVTLTLQLQCVKLGRSA